MKPLSLELSKELKELGFVPIKGYKGFYSINKLGEIYSEKRFKVDGRKAGGHLMRPSRSSSGYIGVNLNKKGVVKRFHIHRLLMETFVPNPDKLPCVNHKNGKRDDNRLENLEWCTYSYNSIDERKRTKRNPWNKGIKKDRPIKKCLLCSKKYKQKRNEQIYCSVKCACRVNGGVRH